MFFLIHVNSLLSQNLLACDNPTNLNTEKEHVNTLAKIILFHKHGFPWNFPGISRNLSATFWGAPPKPRVFGPYHLTQKYRFFSTHW